MNKSKQQLDTDFQVMRILQENPRISQRAMAKKLEMSLGKLNYCLRALIQKGLVKTQNFSQNENKFSYAYLLTPLGMAQKASLTRGFLTRKLEEFDRLKEEIEQLQLENQDNAARKHASNLSGRFGS